MDNPIKHTSPTGKHISLAGEIPEALAGFRLDQALAQLFPDYSRAKLQQWIRDQQVTLDGQHCSVKQKVECGQQVSIEAEITEQAKWEANNIPLSILYEDEDIIVINKPAGLVVHPGAGHADKTLGNALLHHAPELAHLPRAGIIHRLDKDTSGVLVVARSLPGHTSLVQQLQRKTMQREYRAVISGVMISGGEVNAPVGRHPHHRTKMAVTNTGKPAVTHYRVLERFAAHTLLQVQLETGRTHQIRVHMASLRYPLVGDKTYGGRLHLAKTLGKQAADAVRHFPRQALHALQLEFEHPTRHEPVRFTAELPQDINELLDRLRKNE